INGAAMGIFDVRIPGLKMTVVAADGQNIQPVTVDEFRIAVAETYDVIVEPQADRAYTLFAQSNDRSGFARGTLTANPDLHAEVPEMDPAPVLGHRDMGMDMSAMDHDGHDMGGMTGMDHSGHEMNNADHLDHTNHTSHDMHQTGSMDHSQHMDDHSGHNMRHMHDM